MTSHTAPLRRSFTERVAAVEKYLAEAQNDEIDQIPSDLDFQALLDCVRETQAALKTIVDLDDGDSPDLWHFEQEFDAGRCVLTKYALEKP
jgi:hypothetical protein